MANEIYNFLKQNNLTQKSEQDFIKEYSNPDKAKELHGFLQQNNLTKKDSAQFYDEYFKPQTLQQPKQTTTNGIGVLKKQLPFKAVTDFQQSIVDLAVPNKNTENNPIIGIGTPMEVVKPKTQTVYRSNTFKEEVPIKTSAYDVANAMSTEQLLYANNDVFKGVVSQANGDTGLDEFNQQSDKNNNIQAFNRESELYNVRVKTLKERAGNLERVLASKYQTPDFMEQVKSQMATVKQKSQQYDAYVQSRSKEVIALQTELEAIVEQGKTGAQPIEVLKPAYDAKKAQLDAIQRDDEQKRSEIEQLQNDFNGKLDDPDFALYSQIYDKINELSGEQQGLISKPEFAEYRKLLDEGDKAQAKKDAMKKAYQSKGILGKAVDIYTGIGMATNPAAYFLDNGEQVDKTFIGAKIADEGDKLLGRTVKALASISKMSENVNLIGDENKYDVFDKMFDQAVMFSKKRDILNPTATDVQRDIIQKYADVDGYRVMLDENGKPTNDVRDASFYKVNDKTQKEITDKYNENPKAYKTESDFSFSTLTTKATPTILDMGTMMAVTALTGGSSAVMVGTAAAQMYGDMYESGLNAGLTPQEANDFATLTSIMIGMVSLVNPMEANIVKGTASKSIGKFISNSISKVDVQLIRSGEMSIGQYVKRMAKEGVKNTFGENLEELVLEPAVQRAIETYYNTKAQKNGQQGFEDLNKPFFDTKQTIETAMITTMASLLMTPIEVANSVPEQRKIALQNALDNPQQFLDIRQKMLEDGDIEKGKFDYEVKAFEEISKQYNTVKPNIKEDLHDDLAELLLKKYTLKNTMSHVNDEVLNKKNQLLLDDINKRLEEVADGTYNKGKEKVLSNIANPNTLIEEDKVATYNGAEVTILDDLADGEVVINTNNPEIGEDGIITVEKSSLTDVRNKPKDIEQLQITNAVVNINGKEYEGKNHAEAILKAQADGQDISQVDRQSEGLFKLSDGTIINREQAKEQFGQDRSELIIPQDEVSNQANVEYKRIQDEQKNPITPVEPINTGQEVDNGTGIQQADGNGGEIQQGSGIGQVSGQEIPTEKVEERVDDLKENEYYHATDKDEIITPSDKGYKKREGENVVGEGVYFGKNKEHLTDRFGKNTIKAELDIKNPLVTDNVYIMIDDREIDMRSLSKEDIDFLKKKGYDAIKYLSADRAYSNWDETVVFDKSQIKIIEQPKAEPQKKVEQVSVTQKNKQPTISKTETGAILDEIKSKNLTHVKGKNMGENQALGTFISTEKGNRYETPTQKAEQVEIDIQNPFVVDNGDFGLVDKRQEILNANRDKFDEFDTVDYQKLPAGKLTVDNLNDAGIKKLAELTTNELKAQGYDGIYFRESNTQEGELVVFDKEKVKFKGSNVNLVEQSNENGSNKGKSETKGTDAKTESSGAKNTESDTKTQSETTSGNTKRVIRKVKGTPKARRKVRNPEYLKALSHQAESAEDMVLQAFIGGAKISSEIIKKLYTNSGGEVSNKIGLLNKEGFATLSEMAHSLWENQESVFGFEKFDSQEFENAIEGVLNSYSGTKAMVEDLNKRFGSDIDAKQAEEFAKWKEFEANATEEEVSEMADYMESLSEEELNRIYNDKENAFADDYVTLAEGKKPTKRTAGEINADIKIKSAELKLLEDKQSKLNAQLEKNLKENQLDLLQGAKPQSMFDDKIEQQKVAESLKNDIDKKRKEVAKLQDELDNINQGELDLQDTTPEDLKTDNHQVYYNGKVVDMGYIKNPKEQFKYASQRISDNLGTGGNTESVGYVKTPDGKIFEVSRSNKSAKLLSGDKLISAQDKFAPKDADLQSTAKSFTPIDKTAFEKLLDKLKKAFPNVKVELFGKKDFENAKKELQDKGIIVTDTKTKDGTIYGFKTPDGKVFINTDNLNANTPIHEYAHIWQSVFPQEFARGIELLKLSPQGQALIREIQKNPAYKGKTISEIQAEALVTAIGNKGEAIFNSNPTLFNKFKEWLSDFFKKLGDKLGIKDLSADDKLNMFTKKVTGELLGGKALSKNVGENSDIDLQMDKAIKQSKDIELKYNDKGEHLAPNGKPSKLTEQQAKIVRTDAFKNWFGDWENNPKEASKVVDENGEPLVVYHGTNKFGFTEFDKVLNFFSSNKSVAKTYEDKWGGAEKGIYEVFLNIKNIEEVNANGSYFNRVIVVENTMLSKESKLSVQGVVESILGYRFPKIITDKNGNGKTEGVKIINVKDDLLGNGKVGVSDVYVAINPNQIKLADGTNTTFNPESNDIRFQIANNPSKEEIGKAYDKAQQYLETTDFNFDTDQRDAFIEEIKNNPALKAMFTTSQLEKIYEALPLNAVDKIKIKYKLLVYNLKANNSANKASFKQQQKQMVADITALIKGNLGGITGKQAERLTNLATSAVEKNSTVRLGKIINQIANLADQRAYQKAKTLYEIIKARSKRKGGVQSGKLTGVLQDFATINPLDVSDIAKYVELAEKVKQASNVVKQPTDADSDLVYDEVQAYVKAQQDEINSNAINDTLEDDALTFFTVLDNKTKAKFGDDKTFDDLNEVQQREVFESITKDDIKKYGLTDEERDMVEAFKEIKTEQKRQDFITATYVKIGELKDLLANSVGVITQSPAEKEITDALLNVKLDDMTATEMARVLKLINGITQNNDYSGGGAFVAQQKSVEVNSKMNTLKSEIGEFRKLSEGGSKFRNFQQISVAMAKGKKLGAKLMEASGINNLMRGIAKTKTYSHNLQKAFKAEKFKSSVFEPISQMRQSIYAAVIQTKIGDDVKEAEHIERWKRIIEKNIENLRTINKDGYKEQAELLQKALDEVIGDRQQLKDIADNMSKVDSEGKRVVQFFTDNHAEQKPRFRENSLLFHNKEIEEYNSYTKLSITSLTGDTVRDTGEKLMNDARSTGITKKKSKSMIDRANYESLNDNTGLDFNFINKQMKALGDNEYDINTSADITTLANAFNSDNKQLRELLGAENFDLLKKRLQTIVGTSKYEETTVVDDLLNEATKISRTIALGSITQVLKQSTVLMSTYLNSAGKGNIKGLDFTMLFGSKRQKENLQKLFAQSEIGARRAEGAGGYYDNTTIKKNISDGNAKKILKAIGKGKDFFSDLSMYPLRSFDILAADISWITFYKKYLRDNNLVFDENNEFKNPNKEAMAYAETMVQTAQGANTEAGQAEVWGSAKGLTQLALPFMSFAVQAKARLVDNVMNIYNGDDRVEAGRDIGAYVTEQIAFNAVKLGIGTVVATQLIPALLKELGLGDDDEDTKGLSKIAKEKIELEKLRKAEQIKSSFVNNIVQDLTYGTIPMVDNMATKPAINFLYNHIFKTNTGIIPDYNRNTDFNILSGGTVGVGYNQLLNLKDDINIITDNNAFGDYKSQSQVSVFTYNGKDYTIVHNGRYTRRDMFFNNVKGRMDVSNSSVPADILKAFVENPSDFKLKEELRKTGGSQDGDLQLNLTDEQKTYAKIMLMADLLTFYGINETVFNQINNKVRGEMKKQIIKK